LYKNLGRVRIWGL